MRMRLQIAAGVVSALIVAGLALTFGPRVKPDKVGMRPGVEQPVFVVASATSKRIAPATVASVAPTPAPSRVAVAAAPASIAPAPAASRDAAPAATSEASSACGQGLAALAKGDIATARQWLTRAVELGDSRAMMGLGDAYNPAMLTRLGVVGATGDRGKARDYYGRAIKSGVPEARDRLATLASAEN